MKKQIILLVAVSIFLLQPAKSQNGSISPTGKMYADSSQDTLKNPTSSNTTKVDGALEFQNVVLSMEKGQLDEAYDLLVMKFDMIKKELEQYQKLVEQNNLKPEKKRFECTNSTHHPFQCGEAILGQVSPTSQASQISITYFVPQGFASAEVRISNENNKTVLIFKVGDPYYGQALLNAGELEPGIYKYSLFVDNKEMDRKKLIITNENHN